MVKTILFLLFILRVNAQEFDAVFKKCIDGDIRNFITKIDKYKKIKMISLLPTTLNSITYMGDYYTTSLNKEISKVLFERKYDYVESDSDENVASAIKAIHNNMNPMGLMAVINKLNPKDQKIVIFSNLNFNNLYYTVDLKAVDVISRQIVASSFDLHPLEDRMSYFKFNQDEKYNSLNTFNSPELQNSIFNVLICKKFKEGMTFDDIFKLRSILNLQPFDSERGHLSKCLKLSPERDSACLENFGLRIGDWLFSNSRNQDDSNEYFDSKLRSLSDKDLMLKLKDQKVLKGFYVGGDIFKGYKSCFLEKTNEIHPNTQETKVDVYPLTRVKDQLSNLEKSVSTFVGNSSSSAKFFYENISDSQGAGQLGYVNSLILDQLVNRDKVVYLAKQNIEDMISDNTFKVLNSTSNSTQYVASCAEYPFESKKEIVCKFVDILTLKIGQIESFNWQIENLDDEIVDSYLTYEMVNNERFFKDLVHFEQSGFSLNRPTSVLKLSLREKNLKFIDWLSHNFAPGMNLLTFVAALEKFKIHEDSSKCVSFHQKNFDLEFELSDAVNYSWLYRLIEKDPNALKNYNQYYLSAFFEDEGRQILGSNQAIFSIRFNIDAQGEYVCQDGKYLKGVVLRDLKIVFYSRPLGDENREFYSDYFNNKKVSSKLKFLKSVYKLKEGKYWSKYGFEEI